ncbi:MAG TPA: serine/threonine-protein kinase, partial [Polyangia bacterium]|nr:serine/threonine-protein kinase [Polyangia bacterium]
MNADQLVRPGQRIGKYILGEPIARGGMAEVWSARVEGPEGFVKPVALKFVLESFRGDSELERLFVNEARVAAQLQHANLVSVFDFDKVPDGEDGVGGRYYIAMERVDGHDLRRVGQDANRRGQRVPPPVMLHIAGEVLKGLRHVHERRNPQTHRPLGLVHRDVSPHNILIGMGGEVKLSDFGIAKAMAQSFGTQSGLIRGKLAYASPEQLRNEPLDHRTDQFAVGVTLWEGLAGRRLFDGTDAREIITKVNDGVVPALPGDAGVDPRVEAIVRRMLAADARGRFASTAEALSAVLAAPGYTPDGAPLAALMTALFAPAARDVPPTLTLPRRPEKAPPLAAALATTGLSETKTLDRGPDVPAPAPDERETANDRIGRGGAAR